MHEFLSCSYDELSEDIVYDDFIKKFRNNIIYVSDNIILKYHKNLSKGFQAYWNELNGKTFEGINYYGITVIPTSEINSFIENIKSIPDKNIKSLVKICRNAATTKKGIVHFGIYIN